MLTCFQGTIFLLDGNGKRSLRVNNNGLAIGASTITSFATTAGMAWLVDPGRALYQFDEVILEKQAVVALQPVGTNKTISYFL